MLRSSLFALALVPAVVADDAPTVKLSNGDVFGRPLPGAGGVPVNEFLGIPFGKPTKRWEPPEDLTDPLPESPFNATMWGRACLQVLSDTKSYGSEDCLHANVWQPAGAKPTDLKPVMFFTYGGSNQYGEAEPYNMSALAGFHDVVAVNFNYRTGPIGWAAFQTDLDNNQSTGNFGILDIQSALRWVNREIKNFGGDPSRVLIHGQSSGGGLTELAGYIAPGSYGLVSAVISESGGLDAGSISSSISNTERMAKSAGCTGTAAEIKACMVKLPDLTITKMTNTGRWGPSTDGHAIPDDPQKMLAAGKTNPSVKAAVFGAQTLDAFLEMYPQYEKHGELEYMSAVAYETKVRLEYGAATLKLYPAVTDYPAGKTGSQQNTRNLGAIASDQMHCSNRQRAKAISANTKGTGYVYRFDYFYQSNHACYAVPNFHDPALGPMHEDEVTFVMGQPNFMEQGSCCGKWGLSEGEESCPKSSSCVDCYNEKFGTGYHAYFDDKEYDFAQAVGAFWTGFARNGAANATEWPATDSSTAEGGIVLNATLPGGSLPEKVLHDNPAICQHWDAYEAAKRQ